MLNIFQHLLTHVQQSVDAEMRAVWSQQAGMQVGSRGQRTVHANNWNTVLLQKRVNDDIHGLRRENVQAACI